MFDKYKTQEAGQPPKMVEFMVDTHKSKKTNKIIDKRVERIIKIVMEKEKYMLSQETQDGSVQSNTLSNIEINKFFSPGNSNIIFPFFFVIPANMSS